MANRDKFRNRAAACEAHDGMPRSPENGEMIGDVILRRYNRREMMRGTLVLAAIVTLFRASRGHWVESHLAHQ
jgi:uncharacterized protein